MLPFQDPSTADVIAIDMLQQQLPEAQAIQYKLQHGQAINDFDLLHLEGMLHYTHEILPHIQHHKQYAKLTLELIHLYQEIIQQTLNDELALNSPKMVRINAKVIKGEMLVLGND